MMKNDSNDIIFVRDNYVYLQRTNKTIYHK
jgi:hypothetical protein